MKNITVFVIALCVFALSTHTIQAQATAKVVSLNIPDDMRGKATAKTKTYTKEVNDDGIKGLATLKINPDGKIVAISIKTKQFNKVNVNSIRSDDVRMCVRGCAHSPDPFCILWCHIWM